MRPVTTTSEKAYTQAKNVLSPPLRSSPNNPATLTAGLATASEALCRLAGTPMFKHDLRILLVEDHPFQLIATQILLNNQGYFLLTPALNAVEAMIAMERSPQPYDLLLCDQCLPEHMGFDLIDEAYKKGFIRHAIVLSGLDPSHLQALEQQAIDRGIPLLGCLSKPLHGPDLSRLLATLPGR